MSPTRAPEPAPPGGPVSFEEGDFYGLSAGLCRDRQYDDRRLVARRKLLALGKGALPTLAAAGVELECRTSLHHPSPFNGGRVDRLWAYLSRAKAEKVRLRKVLGRDLAKDLDSAYRNAYLCVALEPEALEVSLRIHPDAWYDGQNLKQRAAAEGPRPLLAILRELDGFRLRLHDWRGEWPCGDLPVERLEEFLSLWTPGEHSLAVERRYPAPEGARGAVLETDAAPHLSAELVRLVPLYRYAAWSSESDFLFS